MRIPCAVALSLSTVLVAQASAEPGVTVMEPPASGPIIGHADPGRPITGYVFVDGPAVQEKANSNIIYLNRCRGGCVVTPGVNDSRTDHSSIPPSTAQLPEYPYGDASWAQVVECVRAIYSPFDIIITDEDPGDVNHFEAMVAGGPRDLDPTFPGNVGGVAPFLTNCATINNGISFTFPPVWGDNPRVICETVAQETAHVFGLDHEFLCEDPMTYLVGCGEKFFRDIDAPCGEYDERLCACGDQTQNSFRLIVEEFGAGDPTPPTVSIVAPRDGDTVTPGFFVHSEVTDNTSVRRAELYIDGTLVKERNEPPYVLEAPMDIAQGDHEVTVVGYDDYYTEATASIDVVVGAPCADGSSCASGDACVSGRCVPGPGTPGGLGEDCPDGLGCATGLCAGDSAGNQYCTVSCDVGAERACPCDFSCLDAGGTGVCWPGGQSCDTGGCEVGVAQDGADGDGAPTLPILLGLAFGALFWIRRRR